jgi:hypothetical protein
MQGASPCGIYIYDRNGGTLTIKNNIVDTTEYFFRSEEVNGANLDVDYNTGGNLNTAWARAGSPLADHNLASWQSTYSEDSNSQETNPLLTDPANIDFSLQSTSPCIDFGVGVAGYGTKIRSDTVAGDYGTSNTVETTVTGNRPDCGAYEYPIWGAP